MSFNRKQINQYKKKGFFITNLKKNEINELIKIKKKIINIYCKNNLNQKNINKKFFF